MILSFVADAIVSCFASDMVDTLLVQMTECSSVIHILSVMADSLFVTRE